ncbi:MAG: hypothetical protein IJZ74_07270 [Clostridia bacterium]|nr:hypothetical protein [Clostridia bacterium]
MQNKNKSPILDPAVLRRIRRRQVRNWVILITLVLLVIGAVSLISSFGRTSTITALSLPCYAHQDVTVFQDGVLYYDGASIHFVNAGGGIEWSYPVGDGASFSVSDTHLIIWAGSQLFIVDAKGRPSYNQSMEDPIQFARIGARYAVVVTGDDLSPVLYIKDLQGAQIDLEDEDFEGMLMLDCGFYGTNDEYMWTLAYDVYNPEITTVMNTFQVGQMNTGVVNISDHLAYKVLYANNKLNVFTTQQMYIYDYKGVQDVNNTMLVYGWKYLDHYVPERGSANMLLAPTSQTNSVLAISELRVISDTIDRRYTLPSNCVGAAIQNGRIFAFAPNAMYSGNVNSQRFYAYDLPLPDDRTVSSFIGLTNNGYAIVTSNNEVYSVTLPR